MTPLSSRLLVVAVGALLTCGLANASAQSAVEPRRAAASAQYQTNAEATRQELMQLLGKHPPSVGRVLKLDPSLMRTETYLETYPQLQEFLAAHPEIPQNAQYYLEGVYLPVEHQRRTPQMEMTENVLAGLAAMTVAGLVGGTFVWVIRTILEQRRWSRLSKIQADVHTKLMDRFSSNDELLAYVQTPSGRRFLESGPSPLQESAPAVMAPLSRILWSLQVGAVLLVGGLGLLFLSGRPSIPEVREFFYVAGSIAAAVGTGFVVSAVAAYLLSRRLGLLERPSRDGAQSHA